MSLINAYINFNGNCREAMEFYKECLDAELTLQPIEGSPMESQCPTAIRHQILHATLQKDNLLLMGSDMISSDGFAKGNNIALSLNCNSEKEINSFYDKLSEGGHIIHSLRTEFWGAILGVFTDRFGIRWMLNYDKNPAQRN